MILRVLVGLSALSLTLSVASPRPGNELGGEPGLPADLAERVVELEAHPAAVELRSRFDSAQLVVLGRLEDGERVDVTRAVLPEVDVPLVRVGERGLLRPAGGAAGETALTLRLDELRLELPVRVIGDAPEPDFVRDVMPVLSKVGCTAGGCHGAADGQNGFKLSLRGYDPRADHAALTDDLAGRRFNPVAPEDSLFLLKPTGAVPHEGGAVLAPDSRDYELLRAWVEAGARFEERPARVAALELFPDRPSLPRVGLGQQFRVLATYDDGIVRDVTAEAFVEVGDIEVARGDGGGLVTSLRAGETAVMARYEGAYAATRLVVMREREGFVWPAEPERNWIDELVNEKLRRVRVLPSGLCTDAEFLRRVSLDLTGKAPTPREVRAFLMDRRDSRLKRDEVIDRLIGSAAFVDHQANRWADLLQVNSKFLGDEGARRMRDWLRAAVASNQPYDELVAAVLGASGSTYENPPASYYKVLREPDVAMENTTQLFLGVRFNCNKCHDHPFERWTRDQHWQLAAFLGRVGREDAPGSPRMPRTAENQIDGKPPAFEELVSDLPEGEVTDPDRGGVVPPAFPYEHAAMPPAELPRRERLVRWLTAEENPYFARSYVNRLWSYLLGRGLIEPVDDIRAGNPPTNPALLDRLEREFVESGFDARALMRAICRSRTYQRSLKTNEWNADDELNHSHALARRLPAEVLYDALHQACGSRPELPGQRPGTLAADLVDPSVKAADGFLDLFGRPPRESACECERSSNVSLGQALSILNGETVARAVRDPDSELARLARYEREPRALVEELYLAFLCRPPTEAEQDALAPGFEVSDISNRAALAPADLAWLEERMAAWEAGVRVAEWRVARPMTAHSARGATATIEADGAVLIGGALPEEDHYTVVLDAGAGPVRGLRLEALAHESQPARGPGRAENGNFVLSELRVTAVPKDDPGAARELRLQHATADYSQGGYDVPRAVDGDRGTGWAVSPRFGVDHEAVFESAEDVGGAQGCVLVVTLDQGYGGQHQLGCFRLSVTGSERPIRHHGLPEPVAAALAVPPDARTPAQRAEIHAHFIRTHPGAAERLRVAAAQDLAWALASSPGFLFNR